MLFGASMFVTDYAMPPGALAQALEERGFESFWVPEHSHIPASRRSPWPGGGDLPKRYYDCMDPFVALSVAAATTQRIKLGTGVCLVNQRDPIQTAKSVASLDQLSGGRFLFGIGIGWNAEEMANHGTAFPTRAKLVRERIEAMQAIWTSDRAEYHGSFVDFDPVFAWPKPVQRPHPPIIVGGGFPQGARRALRYGNGWIPITGRAPMRDALTAFRALAHEVGRDPTEVPITAFAAPEDLDEIRRLGELGVTRVVVALDSEPANTILPQLDRWAAIIRASG